MNQQQRDEYIRGLGIEGAEEQIKKVADAIGQNPNGMRWADAVFALDDVVKKIAIDNFPSGLLFGIMLALNKPEVAQQYKDFIFEGLKITADSTLGVESSKNFDQLVVMFSNAWEGISNAEPI